MQLKTRQFRSKPGRSWLLVLGLELVSLLLMWLALVWSGIEKADITYSINLAQNKVKERMALHAKLEVERDRLLTPHELRRKAAALNMQEPAPGQVRRMQLK